MVSLAIFMVTTDIGLLSIALPVIITELSADVALAGWIALIYALVTASLYLPCGRLSDLFGRAKVFRIGFLLYAASSLAAALAHSGGQLIFFRACQAIGSALIMANSFALVTSLFTPQERGRAMGIAGGTVSALGYTLGPVIGGLLTYTFGWRANFSLTAFLAFGGFTAACILLRDDTETDPRPARQDSFDFIGAVTFALGISAILLALTASQGTWHGTSVWGQCLIGLFALGFFVWWEKRTQSPLLDLDLFRIPTFAFGNVARLTSFIAISLSSLLMPLFLQLALKLDPLHSGLLIAPTPLALALLAPVTGWLSERMSARILCAAGLLIKSTACVLLALIALETTSFDIVLRLGLLGVGLGLFQTPNNNSLMSSLPKNRLSIGSSFLSIVRSLGHSGGTALATAIVSARLLALTGQTSLRELSGSTGTDATVLTAFMQGFRLAYGAAAVLCFVGAVLVALPKTDRK